MEDEKLYRIIVMGHVQGVGFRAMTRHFARKSSIRGSVRNRPDGNVEIMVCGPEDDMRLMERFCRSSPGLSRVEDVAHELVEDPALKQKYKKMSEFEIAY
ncbi:MAG: acylphosphatase [Candidatus Woesearchaeota archaeon]